MRKATLIFALIGALISGAFAQNMVNVNAKGDDVRSVIHDLFGQAKKNYVLEPGVRFVLYLSLADVELEEALALICKQAGLSYELQNGIYFVNRKPVTKSNPQVIKTPEKPKGKLPESVLSKKVTTRLQKVELRSLFVELARQTNLTIDLGKDLPDYKIDAFLIGTSLKYALDSVTKAAGLTYRFTEHLSIEIVKPADPNRVVIHKG